MSRIGPVVTRGAIDMGAAGSKLLQNSNSSGAVIAGTCLRPACVVRDEARSACDRERAFCLSGLPWSPGSGF